MNADDYQDAATETAVYQQKAAVVAHTLAMEEAVALLRLNYVVLGLVGEAGELANKLKKVIRDDTGQLDAVIKQTLLDELGDVLWYCAMIADELNTPLSEVMRNNVRKLRSRQERNALEGSGDGR
jgi:NTP pyrophosphatase (non-canonical NTP hydrolase)